MEKYVGNCAKLTLCIRNHIFYEREKKFMQLILLLDFHELQKKQIKPQQDKIFFLTMFYVLCIKFLFRQICMNANNTLEFQIEKSENKQNYLLLNSYSGYTVYSVCAKLVHFLRCCDFQYQYNYYRVLNNMRSKVK